MKETAEFPCSICDMVSSSIREGGLHASKTHNQPYEEYIQFINIHFSKKSESKANEDKVIFFEDDQDPYEDLVVPYDYFVHNTLG